MKERPASLFPQVFSRFFAPGVFCRIFTVVWLVVISATFVDAKDFDDKPASEVDNVELLMSADEAFKKDNHPANRMALIKILLKFSEKSLKIQAAEHARQLIKELPEDPDAHTLYCKAAFLNGDHSMLQKGLRKLRKMTSNEDFNQRWAEISGRSLDTRNLRHTLLVHPAFDFLLYAAYGFAGWSIILAVFLLVPRLLFKISQLPRGHGKRYGKDNWSGAKDRPEKQCATTLKWDGIMFRCSIPVVGILTVVTGAGLWQIFRLTGSLPVWPVAVSGSLVVATLAALLYGLKKINQENT